jgi:thiol:disulfide interchange protein DsbC
MRAAGAAILGMTLAINAIADGDPGMMARLRQKYPATTFNQVNASPLPGVFEVVMGKTVAYVDASGRFFLFGRLYDMQEQRDLTESKVVETTKVEFAGLPSEDAIVRVRGNGRRKIAVFSDPDCPYCKKLEAELAKLNDVTIYTYLMPLDGLHPGAREKAVAVWCSSDRAAAWESLMNGGGEWSGKPCGQTPLEHIQATATKYGITATPTIVFESGRIAPGALPAERISALMAGDQR